MNDTVYAPATPTGCGIAIIRLTGPRCLHALETLFSHKGKYLPRYMYYGRLKDDAGLIDDCMAVFFPAPNSYTGEDCAELHMHGSPAGVKRALLALGNAGLAPAEPGEFTKRAFLNGKLDLSQAEAVMDFISASAQASANAALEQLEGSVARAAMRLQESVTDCIAQLEAALDYPEEDWDEGFYSDVASGIRRAAAEAETMRASGRQGRLLRDGVKVALAGRPNVGKSSLLNALLGQQRAIVTNIPGTTRDLIEETLDWGGIPVRLTDTAGLREAGDEAERIGVDLASKAVREAELVIAVFDGSRALGEEDMRVAEAVKGKPCVAAVTKSDLAQLTSAEDVRRLTGAETVTVTVMENGGVAPLFKAVKAYFDRLKPLESPLAMVTNARHLDALRRAGESLEAAEEAAKSMDEDCACIDLRRAWRALGEITGGTADEAIIDRIFSKFCLGK